MSSAEDVACFLNEARDSDGDPLLLEAIKAYLYDTQTKVNRTKQTTIIMPNIKHIHHSFLKKNIINNILL